MVQRCQLFPVTSVEHWAGLRQQFHRYLAQELVATRTLRLDLEAEKAFTFISVAHHWPDFKFHGIWQLSPCGDHLKFQSNCGSGTLTVEVKEQELRIDYSIFFEHEDRYEVGIRFLTISKGACDLVMSITKPRRMPISYFENKLTQLDEGLERLRRILEG
ncbi:hypothetical protein [Chryseolinea soli]|uniref:SRPBCC family protein n=1 Tax=Chryseolinea soli TaxID=2321403 RepID=A0A385SNQ3_9BACT|nr:hypothetical protein [Chryseolinea soli]AYB32799.1 hypothetical protein D4L85_20430 [Chryseolinea soli]